MERHMGRKTAVGLVFSRGGSSLAIREQNFEDRSIKYCNRLGCSTRLYSLNGIQTGNPEKVKYLRGSFHSMNTKMKNGSSSVSFQSCDFRKTPQEIRRQTSLQGRATAESSDRQRGIEDLDCERRRWEIDNLEYDNSQVEPDSESIHLTRGNQTVLSGPDEFEPVNLQGFSKNATGALGSCSTGLSSRVCKQVSRRHRYGDQEASSSSSRHSSTSRKNSLAAKHAKGGGAELKKSGLKHLNCTSASDVPPSGCSSFGSGPSRRVNKLKKRSLNGMSSSARGQSVSAPLSNANSGSLNRGSSDLGLLMPQQASRRTGAVSVRSRRAPSGVTRTRLSEQRENSPSTPEPVTVAQMPQAHLSVSDDIHENLSRTSSIELPQICHNIHGRPGSSNHTGYSRPISHPEDGSARIFNVPMEDRNGYQHLNMQGIAEVLLALERVEQDEELNYEQLMVLGTNLFLDGLNFHDQHRDMRMDIDNLSYEELLALEEKMGTVSTALTEEALSKCLKRSIYMPASLVTGSTDCKEDIKCSICQEEYLVRDEVGKLACDHRYHVTCIHQWLQQKNWCPICKASACPDS